MRNSYFPENSIKNERSQRIYKLSSQRCEKKHTHTLNYTPEQSKLLAIFYKIYPTNAAQAVFKISIYAGEHVSLIFKWTSRHITT